MHTQIFWLMGSVVDSLGFQAHWHLAWLPASLAVSQPHCPFRFVLYAVFEVSAMFWTKALIFLPSCSSSCCSFHVKGTVPDSSVTRQLCSSVLGSRVQRLREEAQRVYLVRWSYAFQVVGFYISSGNLPPPSLLPLPSLFRHFVFGVVTVVLVSWLNAPVLFSLCGKV